MNLLKFTDTWLHTSYSPYIIISTDYKTDYNTEKNTLLKSNFKVNAALTIQCILNKRLSVQMLKKSMRS